MYPNIAYKALQKGDVVIFTNDYLDNSLVKRAITAEGQTVYINPDTGEVTVDSRLLDEKGTLQAGEDCIMSEQMNIQWYPGHMTKARRMISDNAKIVDIICEIIDARIPVSSQNPDIDDIAGAKARLIIINRTDQADPEVTERWGHYFADKGYGVMMADSQSGKGVKVFSQKVRSALREEIASRRAKGQGGKALRAMIVGVPNVGKSSFINRIAGRRAAEASDRPGVTRGKQWIKIDNGLELLDTPGILWPKFESQAVGENLAFTGAVKDDVLDKETLGANLMTRLALEYPESIKTRYKFEPQRDKNGFELLEQAARKRGFLISGGECDLERMAGVLLDEFRGGKLGRISLEKPEDFQSPNISE